MVTRTVDVVPGARTSAVEVELTAGTRLGRYVITREVGAGGMSLVYEAMDEELDRRIAIKVMRTKYWDRDGQQRALREGQAMAKLSHPNVVAVHDVGALGDQTFIAMELIDGITLKEWLRAAPRTWREILDMLVQAGRGIAAAHAAGLVHRDVKPSNVLVDARGRVLVTDFGIARPMRASQDAEITLDDVPPLSASKSTTSSGRSSSRSLLDAQLTRTGAVVGTPAYMAPEQRKGKSGSLADQYSFCVMAHEALLGVRPSSAPASSDSEPDAEVAPARSAPRWLRKVIARGLSVDPAARYPDMNSLLAALTADRGGRRVRVALAVGAVGLVVAAIAAWSARNNSSPPCEGVDAGAARAWNPIVANQVRQAFIATGRGYAADTFRRLDGLLAERRNAWSAKRRDTCAATRIRGEQSERLLDLRMQCLDRRLGELAALTSVLAWHADGAVVDAAVTAVSSQRDLALCDDTAALEQAIPPPEDPVARVSVERLRTRLDDVAATAVAGRYSEALRAAVSVASDAEQVGWAPSHARALYWLGRLQSYNGDSETSAPTLQRAMVRAGEARDDALMADAGLELIYVLGYELARPDEALRTGDLVAAMVRRAGGDPTREAQLLDRIGIVLWAKHSLPEAQQRFEQALALYAKAPDSDERTAATLTNLGNVLADQGKFEEARQQYEAELAILRRIHGPDHPTTARSLANIGTVLQSLHRLDDAQQAFERALAIWERSYGPKHPMVAMVTNNLGDLLLERGDATAALGYCRRAAAIGRETLPEGHPVRAYHLVCVADALLQLGRVGEAIKAYDEALAIRVAAGNDPAEVAEAQSGLAKAHWALGTKADRAAARELANKAIAAYRKAGEAQREKVDELDDWLRKHP
ncbi:MAG TPA: serine/threonine-protein kinase [Kofleriaceae bacterium]